MPSSTDYVRLLIFLRKKPGMTLDEFTEYWAEEHAPLFESMDILKKNILKYERAYANPTSSTLAQAMQLTVVDFDGIVVFEAESVEKLTELFGSEEYARKIVPDEPKFPDRSKCQLYLQQFDGVDG